MNSGKIINNSNNIGYNPLLRSQLIGSLLDNQANLILLVFTTHVDPHDHVIACTCLSAVQSAASAFYSKLATGQTAFQRGRTLTTETTQQQTEHTNHSSTGAEKM